MSTILNEKIWFIGKYNDKNLKKAEKKFIKADNKYVGTEDKFNKKTNGDLKTLDYADKQILKTEKEVATGYAKKFDKIDKSIEGYKTKKNEKIANKLIDKEKFARKFDYSKMTPELKSVWNKKLEARAEALSTGQGPEADGRSRVGRYIAKEEGNKFLSLYDNFPILSESYNPAELQESYTHEDFAELILENVVNAESLDTFQLLVLAESLGYEYLEEAGKWSRINNLPGVSTGKKLVAGGLVTLAAMSGGNGIKDHNTVRDLRANLGANTQEINTAKAGIDKMKELQLQGYKIGVPDIGAEKESERLGSKVQELESKNRVISSKKAKATKKRDTRLTQATSAGVGAGVLGVSAVVRDNKKKKEMEKDFNDKNDQVKNLKDQLKAKQDAEAKKSKK